MYYLPAENLDFIGVTKERTIQQIHQIMGHCNSTDLIQLQGVVDGLKITNPEQEFFCDISVVKVSRHTAQLPRIQMDVQRKC